MKPVCYLLPAAEGHGREIIKCISQRRRCSKGYPVDTINLKETVPLASIQAIVKIFDIF